MHLSLGLTGRFSGFLWVSTKNESRSLVVWSIPSVQSFHLRNLGLMLTVLYYSGSYTFAKTLEYKAKHGLNAGKEVTVMPPAEYHDRFVSALEGYFLACPGLFPISSDITECSRIYRRMVQAPGRIEDFERPQSAS
jgi:hypothetical protein